MSVVFTGSHSFLMSLCKDEHGNIPFVSTDVVLLIEASKCLVCFVACWPLIMYDCAYERWVQAMREERTQYGGNAACVLMFLPHLQIGPAKPAGESEAACTAVCCKCPSCFLPLKEDRRG